MEGRPGENEVERLIGRQENFGGKLSKKVVGTGRVGFFTVVWVSS